jgi:hypothetical protein
MKAKLGVAVDVARHAVRDHDGARIKHDAIFHGYLRTEDHYYGGEICRDGDSTMK